MNTANKLTMLRVIMIPAFLAVLYWGFSGSQYVAMAIFAAASLTDFADGRIARSRGQVTDFGKFLESAGRQGACRHSPRLVHGARPHAGLGDNHCHHP